MRSKSQVVVLGIAKGFELLDEAVQAIVPDKENADSTKLDPDEQILLQEFKLKMSHQQNDQLMVVNDGRPLSPVVNSPPDPPRSVKDRCKQFEPSPDSSKSDEVSGDDVLASLVDFSTLSTFCVMVGALYLKTATAS